MIHQRIRIGVAYLTLAAIGAGGVALAQTGGGFDLSWSTIDGGGQTFSTGGGFTLAGTIGQPDASSPLTGGGFSLTGGFLPGAAGGPSCPADLDGTNDVDGADLGQLLLAWSPTAGSAFGSPADLNGDGKVDGADLGLLLLGWGACP